MSQNIDNNLLKTKQHFEILDGLRGIAALVVVVFHFMEIAITDYEKNFIAHGYLAVDFFFCLSGFVVAYAYDSRIKEMGFSTFMKHRLIRLHPLIIIGSVLGLITFLIDPFSHLYLKYGFGGTFMLFITSLLLIPYPVVEERFYNNFNLNAPMWSLFWEYVANIIYALGFYKIAKKYLAWLIVLAVVFLLYTASKSTNISGGWGGENFIDGLARIGFSFLMGMLLYRTNMIIKNKLGLWPIALILLATFLVPYRNAWNWIVEPVLVIFVFPLIVMLGAGTVTGEKSKKLNQFSGEISYPLYMTHYPFVWIFLTYVATQKPSAGTLWVVIPVSVVLLIIFAWLMYKWVDQPLRNYLSKKMKN